MMEELMRVFAVTGASGGGKSAIIEALASGGARTSSEIGREIVREQMETGGEATPWRDPVAFRDLLFRRSLRVFDDLDPASGGPVFLDRTFLEAVAYCRVVGMPVPEPMMRAARARRLAEPVFVCPPWKDIFVADRERRHGFEYACRDYEANIATYRGFGYRLVEVPKAPVETRAAFVLNEALAA